MNSVIRLIFGAVIEFVQRHRLIKLVLLFIELDIHAGLLNIVEYYMRQTASPIAHSSPCNVNLWWVVRSWDQSVANASFVELNKTAAIYKLAEIITAARKLVLQL